MNKSDLKELVKNYFNLEDKNSTNSEDIAKETFAGAKLIDGTEISTDGEGGFAVGQVAHVVTEEGEKVLAPSGEHELEDGTVLVIDGEGMITGLKTKDGEGEGSLEAAADMEEVEMSTEEATEEKVELADHDEAEIEVGDEPISMDEHEGEIKEAIVEAILAEIAPQMEELKTKMAEMEEKMKEHYAATPATESTVESKFARGNKFSSAASWSPNLDLAKGMKRKQYEAVLKNNNK